MVSMKIIASLIPLFMFTSPSVYHLGNKLRELVDGGVWLCFLTLHQLSAGLLRY